MIKVRNLRCTSFDLDRMDLFWEVQDYTAAEDIRRYQFTISRSESVAGPYTKIGGPLVDTYHFRDTTPSLLHKWRSLYYKLSILDTVTSETAEVDPVSLIAEPDLVALEIMRQEDVLFREHIGRRCWLFPVRTFGARCFCFDRVSGRRSRSNCANCYDTGYLGGYFSPIEIWLQIDPSINAPANTQLMRQQPNDTSARMISFPLVKPDDVIIEAENLRWRVTKVNMTQRLRAPVHQELVLHEVPLGDVEYKLPVNIADLSALTAAASRNFTNPQHVDAVSDLKNAISLYQR